MENSRENAAAISLCSLGLERDTPSTLDPPQSGIATANDGQTRAVVSAPSIQQFFAPVAPTSTDAIKTEASAPRRKYNVKPRDPKRDTSVSFDEMKRLMRVYGPIKCQRVRTPKDSGKYAKPESIRRKFYRWFPDFDQRFEKTPDGWYKPKNGHEAEMAYREEMRKQDQATLVKKRFMKRCGKPKENPPNPANANSGNN